MIADGLLAPLHRRLCAHDMSVPLCILPKCAALQEWYAPRCTTLTAFSRYCGTDILRTGGSAVLEPELRAIVLPVLARAEAAPGISRPDLHQGAQPLSLLVERGRLACFRPLRCLLPWAQDIFWLDLHRDVLLCAQARGLHLKGFSLSGIYFIAFSVRGPSVATGALIWICRLPVLAWALGRCVAFWRGLRGQCVAYYGFYDIYEHSSLSLGRPGAQEWNVMVEGIIVGCAGLVQYLADAYPPDLPEYDPV
jgi:hypothetical protein